MNVAITELGATVSPYTILKTLEEVYDPELGVDILNLGLIYDLHIIGGNIAIAMTLTTPGCPMHESIQKDIVARLERLPEVAWIDVQLVWDPPWSPERMTDEAKRQLSWL